MPSQIAISSAADHRGDVLVVGGGPAGAPRATLLARYSRDADVLQHPQHPQHLHHPRSSLGESLLPAFACGISCSTPIRESLRVFKTIHDLLSFAHPGRTPRALRERGHDHRDVEACAA